MGNKIKKNKKITMRTLIFIALVASACAITWNVPAGKSVSIVNPLPVTMNAKCTLATSGTNKVCGTAVKGSAVLSLPTNDSPCMYLYHDAQFKITANVGDSATFINNGASAATATCDDGNTYSLESGGSVVVAAKQATTSCTANTPD